MIISHCSQRSSCFDMPVLSKVEVLSTKGFLILESFFPFTLSLSKPVLSPVEGGERLWIILNWKQYKEASHVYYPSLRAIRARTC
jgi:hypothetical protein